MGEDMISIIVPVYNVEKYVYKCLYSLVHQTYKNLQIIVVDDGSTDASYEVASEFLEKDSRFEVYRKDNGGLSDARNFGLKYVKGKYICFVDSDDWVSEDYVETLRNLLREEVDISCADFDLQYDNRSRLRKCPMKNKTYSASEAMIELCRDTRLQITAWGKMYRAELFDGIFFETGRVYEDVAIMHQLFSKARNISCTSRVVYHYNLRSDSIAHQNTSKNNMDYFLSFSQRYNYLEDETANWYTLKRCLQSCYKVLYLSNGLIYAEEDLRMVKSFWEKHKNAQNMGLMCYLMCKHPRVYFF